MAWISRLRALFRRNKLASDDLDEELAFHLSMREQWNVEHGMPPAEAHRDARRRFGNPLRMARAHERDRPDDPATDHSAGSATTAPAPSSATPGLPLSPSLPSHSASASTPQPSPFTKRCSHARLMPAIPGRMVNLDAGSPIRGYRGRFQLSRFQGISRTIFDSFSGVIAHSVDRLTLSAAGGPVRNPASGSFLGRLGLLPPSAIDAEFATTFEVSENYFSVLGVNALRGRTFDAMSAAELAAIALGSHQRKLLAEEIRGRSCRDRQGRAAQWRALHHHRHHAARLRRHQRSDTRFLVSAQPCASDSPGRQLAPRSGKPVVQAFCASCPGCRHEPGAGGDDCLCQPHPHIYTTLIPS